MRTFPRFEVTEVEQRRFWSKVALPDENGCMLWQAAIDVGGYGRIRVAGSDRKAHRVALTLAAGQPPESNMDAAHACRNRHCVAPSHLRWATRSENIADKLRDGTDQFGVRNAMASLTEDQVKEMRRRYAAGGVRQKDLAAEFGIARASVGSIVTGVNWRHLDGDDAPVSRGPRPLKTHCPHGHEYTPENTFYRKPPSNQRECVTCMRERCRRQRAARKAAS